LRREVEPETALRNAERVRPPVELVKITSKSFAAFDAADLALCQTEPLSEVGLLDLRCLHLAICAK